MTFSYSYISYTPCFKGSVNLQVHSKNRCVTPSNLGADSVCRLHIFIKTSVHYAVPNLGDISDCNFDVYIIRQVSQDRIINIKLSGNGRVYIVCS